MHHIDLVDRALARYGDRPCLHDGGERSITFAETRTLMWRTAAAIRAVGLSSHAGIGILSPNDIEAYVIAMGAERSGNVRLQINLRDGPDLIAQVLRFNDCEIVFYHSAMAALADDLRARLPAVRQWICIDRVHGADPTWRAWIAGHADTPFDAGITGESVIVRATTGGTTGLPKTVQHQRSLFQLIITNTTYYCFPHGDDPAVHLAVAPTTHAAGQLCYPALLTGGLNIMIPHFDVAHVADIVERFRVTMVFMPPTAIYMLLAQPDVERRDWSSLRYFMYAAAPMSVQKLRDALRVFGPVMAQFYAQTEAGMPLTFLSPAEHLVIGTEREQQLASCGRPTPWSDVAIMGDDGTLLPPNERGEIVCRGDQVMLGYYKNPEATEATRRHGWHATGDVGFMDEQGYFYVVDRAKDMIITGGFNVYPTEVEQVVSSHPAVQDCAVVGVPDEKWGEAVTAIVQLKPGQSVEEGALIAHCRTRLGPIQTPKRVEFWPDLPRSPVGKVLKKDIRAKFWAGRDRMV